MDILLVDDDPLNINVESRMIGKLGHDVETVAVASSAVEMAKAKAYRLVFLDHLLPDMTGEQAAVKIRASSKNPDIVIVALTGAKDAITDMAVFDEIMEKPVTLDDFRTVFAKLA